MVTDLLSLFVVVDSMMKKKPMKTSNSFMKTHFLSSEKLALLYSLRYMSALGDLSVGLCTEH